MPKVRSGVLMAAVMSTSLAVAVPAHADNGSDFLATLSAEGISIDDSPAGNLLTLQAAQAVCHQIHYGFSPQEASLLVTNEFPNVTPQQAMSFVGAAQANLCAQFFAPLHVGGW